MNNPQLDREWYLDLDRTLFDTESFGRALFGATERIYAHRGVKRRQLLAESTHMFHHMGDLYYYPFFDHLAQYGIEASEAKKLLHEALEGKDFLYQDAHELLDWLEVNGIQPHILTFGDDEYQRFKIASVPRLSKLPVSIVVEPKGQFLARQVAKPSILIDDKPINDLPDWCTGALICRKNPVAGYNGLVIKSLKDAKDLAR